MPKAKLILPILILITFNFSCSKEDDFSSEMVTTTNTTTQTENSSSSSSSNSDNNTTNPLTTITPTSTFALTGNITFKNYLHESLPSEWIAEYNTIMQNMIELAPTSIVPWFEEELNIFAWLDDIDKPFTVSVQDWDGTEKSVTVEGQCLCGYGDKRWMSLEMFSPEFEGEFPSNHRFSVVVHEYYHVYQSTLSESFTQPNGGDTLNPEGFDILWLAEGTAATIESLYIQQYYGVNYFEEGFGWLDFNQAITNPAAFESRDVEDTNYGGATFMILALAKEIEATGKTPEDAFNLILKEFWKTNANNQNWKVSFENVFGLSLETFYSNLSGYSNDISLYYPPSDITLQNILRN